MPLGDRNSKYLTEAQERLITKQIKSQFEWVIWSKTLHMDITRWSTLKSDWLCSMGQKMEKLYTVSKNKTGSWLRLDHELFIAKFRFKLKKVGKTTRPFRYDQNQILYDYTVKVRNRFKGLDLKECLMNYGSLFVTLYRRQGSRSSPRKRHAKKQNGCVGRTYK